MLKAEERAAGPRLDIETLAVASSCAAADIRDFVARGLIEGPAADGTFARGDMARLRLLAALLRSGLDLDQMTAAVASGRLSFGFAGEVIAEPVGLADHDHATALAALGLDAGFAERLQLAIGLPLSQPSTPIREDDRELYALVATALGEGIPKDALLRVLRAFGLATRTIVAAQRDLYRQTVEEPLLEAGMSHNELLVHTAAKRLRLQRLGYRATFLLLRRFLEEAVFENIVARLEEGLAEAGIVRGRSGGDEAIAFADLAGFTRLTEEQGDDVAAEHGLRFIELVQETCARFGGRLVKPLGDGVMLHFRTARNAVAGVAALFPAVAEAGLPELRAGIAKGPLVGRDGDCFGGTVNLAARLAASAGAGEIWTIPAVAETAADGPITFEARAPRAFKGLSGPIAIMAARITL